MCGIAFIYHQNGHPASAAQMQRMVQAIAHRGPDAQTQLLRGNVALGHTRLSIVDVQGGHQPMLSADGRYALIYNGEIYNYQALRDALEKDGVTFTTHSDTEVILHLFEREGIQCLQRLRGMFAFAMHDGQSNTLWLARDRLGIKPAFYHWDGAALLGASEIKSIFASGRVEPRLNKAAIHSYFQQQFSVTPQTPFEEILELPAGSYLKLEPDQAPQIQAYWDLEFPPDGEYESLEEDYWLQRFGDALDEAASSHMIGEVPIGAYLSGGVDSATTSRLLKEHYPQTVQTFTIGFGDPQADESQLAREIAQHLGVPNEQITVAQDGQQDLLAALRNCIYHLEQPQRMAVDVPHYLLSGLVRSKHYKVVYTGDGADEILGGYDCYRQDYIRQWGNDKTDAELRRDYYLNQFKDDFAQEHMQMLMSLHAPEHQAAVIQQFGCYPAWHDFWHILDDVSQPLLTPAVSAAANAEWQQMIAVMRPKLEGRHWLNQSLYMETKTRLPGWILWKSDRLSMANSVEARVPFMDHPLVELAARVPPELKLNGMDEKYILRKLAMPHLPQHPTYYKKRAFYTPIREWFFQEESQAALDSYLSDAAIEECGCFEAETVQAYLKAINEYGQPKNMEEYYRVMKLEWALMLVLTVQMLHVLFVKRQAPCFQSL